jgi:hypothetical protein
MSWHPQDPRSWGGWAPHDPRWGRHQPTWGWGHPARPLYDNQLGYRLPSGGPPAAGQMAAGVALLLFALSPFTLFAWVAGQALLRATGVRWWKLALACLTALAAGIAQQGGLGPALAHHFVGYLWFFRQFGASQVEFPTVGAFLWPQLPLAVPIGLLTAALNQAGRPRQAIDPAEVKRKQREAATRMAAAVKRAGRVRDDHWQVPALGAQVDGDLGWTDRRGLVVVPPRMQARSRLIIGTSGMGKTVDAEREAFLAAKAGRKFFIIDGKGTDPTFVERALAGYLWGHPHARVGIWPELPMDGWRGSPAAVHNRLLAMLSWTEPYKDIASLLLRLALNAPGEDGPVRSSAQLLGRLDPEALANCYEHQPDRLREARSLCGREQARAVQGAISRLANFFAAVGGGFDAAEGGYSFEDIDFGYFRAPYLAGREDADACCRLLLEDFAHYATLRKPRRGEDATLVFDEFSAIAGGRETAIQLVERVRDACCAVYLSAQSSDGLGDERQQARLVGACSGGLLVHAMPNPHGLLAAAGMVKVIEQTWRLDSDGPTGNSSARIGERAKIDPSAVQQGREGEAWLIARGRYEHLMVARTQISDAWRARARAIVALARSWRPQETLPGAQAWRDAQQAAQGALAGLAGHLAIQPPPDHRAHDGDPEGGPLSTAQAEVEPRTVIALRYRLRLAVAAAARQADTEATAAIIREGERRGLDTVDLFAVAARHWPKPRMRIRARQAGQRWVVGGARWAWTHRPHRPTGALVQRESRP